MASGSLKSIAVALESSFGSIAAANGAPDASGLSYAGLEAERATLIPFGATDLAQRAESRATFSGQPPEPILLWDVTAATRSNVRKGSITLTLPLRTLGGGAAYATYDLTPMGRLLGSGLVRIAATAASVVCDDAGNLTLTNVDVAAGTGANVKIGDVFAVAIGGRVEYAAVTNRVVDNITYSPATSAPLTTHTLRLCDVWVPYYPGASLGSSVALRLDGDGWRTYAVGARLQSARIYADAGAMRLDLAVRCEGIYDAHAASALSEPTRASGSRLLMRGSYAVMSSTAIGSTTPAQLGRTALVIDGWESTVENTLIPVGASGASAIGASDLEVGDVVETATVNLGGPNAATEVFVRDQEQRSFLLGCGSNGAIAGNAGCVYIPGGYLSADSLRTAAEGEIVKQVLPVTAGAWTLDTGAPAAGVAVDQPWRLALAN